MNEITIVIARNSDLIFIVWFVCTIASTYIGMQRGFPFLGFINGLILGPLGLFFVIIQKNSTRYPCPNCAEQILKKAKVCPHCQRATNT
jgi:hypothetical protein